MKSNCKIGMVLLAGVTMGGLAVEGLHAQAKMPVYYVSEIDVRDVDAYSKDYAPKAQALIKSAGGRFVAIGGVAGNLAGNLTAFDGDAPKRMTVSVWDSLEKIKAWRASPQWAELRKAGEKYATFSRAVAIDGVPQ